MKYIFLLIAASWSCALVAQDPTVDWETYEKDNYQIEYPSDWELDLSGNLGQEFSIYSPLVDVDGEYDEFSENFNLLIQDVSAFGVDLDGYTKISENQIGWMIKDGKILKSERKNQHGRDYQHMQYTGEQQGLKLMYEQYYWVIDGKAYVLSFVTEEVQYESYKEEGKRILDSFTFDQ